MLKQLHLLMSWLCHYLVSQRSLSSQFWSSVEFTVFDGHTWTQMLWTRFWNLLLLTSQFNSSSLNKGSRDHDSVWISDHNWHSFLRFWISTFSFILVLIEKIYQTLKTVFKHISKHLIYHQKYSTMHHIFNSLLGAWKCGQTQFFIFDILLKLLGNCHNLLHSVLMSC